MQPIHIIVSIVFVLQITLINYGEGAKILVLFAPPAPSHFILGKALVNGLLKKEHEVTFVTPYGMKKQVQGLEDIILSDLLNKEEDQHKILMDLNKKSALGQFTHILENTYLMTENVFNNSKIQELFATKKYDLIILDAVLNEAHVVFAHNFDCPIIIVSTLGASLWINGYVANPAPPSYVPQVFDGLSTKMSFMERVKNTIFTYVMQVIYYGYHLRNQEYLLHKYYPDAPPLKELIAKRTALVLLNSHSSISPAKPSVPNMIEIGGYHIEEPKPLPKELKQYLDNAKEGFILFSMGSNLKSTKLPIEIRDSIMKVFTNLPYKILWKFENDQLPNKPDNVKIEKWLPQNDILAHPNLKLFITHGGLLSTTEAVYHGVPIVGIPVFGDQKINMVAAENLGIGKTVHFQEVTYEKLYATVQEVLTNKKYKEAAKQRSALLRDQPLRPIDNAMYWIEYVLRHKYADHLKTGAINLTWYQEMCLDVITFLVSIIFGTVLILYKIAKCFKRQKVMGKKHKD